MNLLNPDRYEVRARQPTRLRIGKILRFGGAARDVSLDLFNALNADTVLTSTRPSSPAAPGWCRRVLTARTAKITVQYDF